MPKTYFAVLAYPKPLYTLPHFLYNIEIESRNCTDETNHTPNTPKGLEPNLYFYRDNHQNEVDIIYKRSNELVPIEIKASQTYHPDFLKGIKYFASIANERVKQSYLVYTGTHEQKIGDIDTLNFKQAHRIVE